jgi:hypothetical protein
MAATVREETGLVRPDLRPPAATRRSAAEKVRVSVREPRAAERERVDAWVTDPHFFRVRPPDGAGARSGAASVERIGTRARRVSLGR